MKAILKHGGSYSVFNKIFHIGKPVSVTEKEWNYLSELETAAGEKLFRKIEEEEAFKINYQAMSVDELKAELSKKDVQFGPNSNKKTLVNLLESLNAKVGGDVAI